MRYVILVVVVILVALLSAFGIQNPNPVNVRFAGAQSGPVPLYIIILVSTLVGIMLSSLLNAPGRIQRTLELRRLRQQVVDLERQVEELKARVPPPVMKPLPDEPAAKH